LALLGEGVRSQAHPEALINWAEAAPALTSRGERITAAVLSLLMLVFGSYWAGVQLWMEWMALRTPPEPFTPLSFAALRYGVFLLLAVNGLFFWRLRYRVLS